MGFVFSFVVSALISVTVCAQTRSAKALSTEVTNTVFKATLLDGYHFNEQAPNEIRMGTKTNKPSVLQKQFIEFTMPADAKTAGAKATLYVCDDAKTYCETHSVDLYKTATTTAATAIQPSSVSEKLQHGFIQNNMNRALELANRSNPKKLVLLDFSARWCPGCVRYEKEIFPTKEFQQLTKNIVKVKVDVDLFQNSQWTKKYNVSGIPALIVVNHDGKVVDQIVDFRPFEKLQVFVNSVVADPTPAEEINDQNPANFYRLGKRLLASGNFEKSLEYLKKVQPEPPELLTALIEKEDSVENLRMALKKEPNSTRSIQWRAKLAKKLENDSKATTQLLTEGEDLVKHLLRNPKDLAAALKTDEAGEMTGFEKMMITLYLADLGDNAKASAERMKNIWLLASEAGRSYKIPATASGPGLRYLIILSASENYTEAEAWANKMLKVDPKNLDIQRRKIRILNGLKKYQEAIDLGERIIDQSEDRNQFWVAESLAKSYIAAERKNAARLLLRNYLARPEINAENMKSSKKSMEELLKSLETKT